MSFSQNTNSFYIKGTVAPAATKLGAYGYDCEFILNSGSQILHEEDYMVPPNQTWQIALAGVEFVHMKECFHFPTAVNAKTKEWNNVYDLYEIEIEVGILRYWPVLKDGNTAPWHPEGTRVMKELEEYVGPPGAKSKFALYNYFKSIVCENVKTHFYKENYDYIAVNKQAINNWTDRVAPVLRCNLLEVIERLGYLPDKNFGTYALTASQFVHVLNNLFTSTELNNLKKSVGFGVGVNIHSWPWFPKNLYYGRNGWIEPLDMIPKFNIVCNKQLENGDKYIVMEIKVPLPVQYIAFGSILKNICGFQTLSKTKPIINPTTKKQERRSLSIIYNARQNAIIAPAKVEKVNIAGDTNAYIATPHFPTGNITMTSKKLYHQLWSFPKIPIINGVENDFKAFIINQGGNKAYDFLTIQGQNPINPINAGDIFFYTSTTLIKWTHIGNYQSPLIAHTPCPVYGFGKKNLEKDPTKTVDIETGTIQLAFEPDQLEYHTITEERLRNFNVDPRNAYGDRLQIPITMFDFSIKRVR